MGLITTLLTRIGLVAIAFLIFNAIRMFKPFTTHTPVNDDKCEIIPGVVSVEDYIEFNGILIGFPDYRRKLWYSVTDANKAEDGYIITFDPKTKAITRVPNIEGFPNDIAFHPHGVTIKGDDIYVINHAYKKGSERVEVLRASIDDTGKIRIRYLRSLIFGDEYQGMFNGLAVVGENKFFITSWKIKPDSLEGPVYGNYAIFKLLALRLFNLKLTKLYYCDGFADGESVKPNCKEVEGGQSYLNNGIAIDETNTYLYVADSLDASVRKFKVDGDKITLVDTIDVLVHADNLVYDKVSGKIYAAGCLEMKGIATIMHHLTRGEDVPSNYKFWAGATTIDTRNGDKVELVLSQKDYFRAVSVAKPIGNSIVSGSFFEDGVMLCQVK
jgi:sugar lactone lactonase YvrE